MYLQLKGYKMLHNYTAYLIITLRCFLSKSVKCLKNYYLMYNFTNNLIMC